MECIHVSEAYYVEDFKIFLKFNTGESGAVDLKDVVYENECIFAGNIHEESSDNRYYRLVGSAFAVEALTRDKTLHFLAIARGKEGIPARDRSNWRNTRPMHF